MCSKALQSNLTNSCWMTEPISLILSVALVYNAGTTAVFAQERDVSQDFEKCKMIANDQARLGCLKNLLPNGSSGSAASAAHDSLSLVRPPHPKARRDAVAIMRTADTGHTDPD